jgi:hypothetical protein
MPQKSRLVSGLLSLTVIAGTLAGAVEQSAAGKLSDAEIAALGLGAIAFGLGIATFGHGPGYYDNHSSPWEDHVERCYERYRTYDDRTDTYIGLDGLEHRCLL